MRTGQTVLPSVGAFPCSVPCSVELHGPSQVPWRQADSCCFTPAKGHCLSKVPPWPICSLTMAGCFCRDAPYGSLEGSWPSPRGEKEGHRSFFTVPSSANRTWDHAAQLRMGALPGEGRGCVHVLCSFCAGQDSRGCQGRTQSLPRDIVRTVREQALPCVCS